MQLNSEPKARFHLFKKLFRRSGTPVPEVASSNNRFLAALERIKASPLYNPNTNDQAPHGLFDGRRIIGDSNRINGGVYLGVIAHEAVVVDDSYGRLEELYQQSILKFVRDGGRRSQIESDIFRHVIKFAEEQLPLDPARIRKLAHQRAISPDRKIALDFYLREKAGAARHQVLLAAYLLQRMRERKLINGEIVIDPHFSELPAEDESLVYIGADGARFVFSPTLQSH
ncbi:MAG: hypothetical protein K1X83_15615 [Oligoflexia bacterium]|nr:hypothetical protein [Oligoflexia bacterium]